ncbi:MAG: membrane protein insertion efficiency factor YidD [Candidatus Levybacteria bacterium]|nr:membrane protein insertion efficiency factor YidD [Candidatus Levybacteria bacterium]
MRSGSILFISIYQIFFSTLLKNILGVSSFCRNTSLSCSEYTKKSILKYGFFKGSYLGIKRVIGCNPFIR